MIVLEIVTKDCQPYLCILTFVHRSHVSGWLNNNMTNVLQFQRKKAIGFDCLTLEALRE